MHLLVGAKVTEDVGQGQVAGIAALKEACHLAIDEHLRQRVPVSGAPHQHLRTHSAAQKPARPISKPARPSSKAQPVGPSVEAHKLPEKQA